MASLVVKSNTDYKKRRKELQTSSESLSEKWEFLWNELLNQIVKFQYLNNLNDIVGDCLFRIKKTPEGIEERVELEKNPILMALDDAAKTTNPSILTDRIRISADIASDATSILKYANLVASSIASVDLLNRLIAFMKTFTAVAFFSLFDPLAYYNDHVVQLSDTYNYDYSNFKGDCKKIVDILCGELYDCSLNLVVFMKCLDFLHFKVPGQRLLNAPEFRYFFNQAVKVTRNYEEFDKNLYSMKEDREFEDELHHFYDRFSEDYFRNILKLMRRGVIPVIEPEMKMDKEGNTYWSDQSMDNSYFSNQLLNYELYLFIDNVVLDMTLGIMDQETGETVQNPRTKKFYQYLKSRYPLPQST